MSHFNTSDAVSSEFGIFGIPSSEEGSRVVLLPVPWEVTTSYGVGASLGPQIILQASEQVDLFDLETEKAYEAGYFMKEIPKDLFEKSRLYKAKAQELIKMKMRQENNIERQSLLLDEVNNACAEMVAWVKGESKKILKSKKLLGLIGGDHSTPLGAIQALHELHGSDFGILHIDAHADLRPAYQGFTHSHASIMHNVMTGDHRPQKLVQVGIRDFCEEEFDFIKHHKKSIHTYFDIETKRRLLSGDHWDKIATEIISNLPEKVYISFDIDGLDPALCPNTGTPVAGGLSLDQAFYLFYKLAQSQRKIIGFDLNEVSPGTQDESEWDGNVGARVLYKLCGWSVVTNS